MTPSVTARLWLETAIAEPRACGTVPRAPPVAKAIPPDNRQSAEIVAGAAIGLHPRIVVGRRKKEADDGQVLL